MVVVFDLFGDYDEWKQVFNEDLPERRKFSDRMVPGVLDNNQVAILAYDVNVKAMQAFMGTEEFRARTAEFHGVPEIYQMNALKRSK